MNTNADALKLVLAASLSTYVCYHVTPNESARVFHAVAMLVLGILQGWQFSKVKSHPNLLIMFIAYAFGIIAGYLIGLYFGGFQNYKIWFSVGALFLGGTVSYFVCKKIL